MFIEADQHIYNGNAACELRKMQLNSILKYYGNSFPKAMKLIPFHFALYEELCQCSLNSIFVIK
jgi:hypothetical protein